MAGNQNFIESGLSSATQRRADARAEKKRQQEQELASHITPGADIIIDWIDAELDKVCDLRHMVLHIADKELARDEILAVKMHMDFLEDLKARAKKMVRVADRQDKQARKVEHQLKKELAQEKEDA